MKCSLVMYVRWEFVSCRIDFVWLAVQFELSQALSKMPMNLPICISRILFIDLLTLLILICQSVSLTFHNHQRRTRNTPHYSFYHASHESIATESIPDLGLQLRVGPSQVVPNQLGLYLESLYPQERVIPRGTVICRYASGYFTDDCKSDKSVGFLYEGSGSDENTDLVMYRDQLMTLESAIQLFSLHRKEINLSKERSHWEDILWGHIVTAQPDMNHYPSFHVQIHPQPDFPWVFEPFDLDTNPGGSFTPWSPTQLGKFANDLAFDPNHDGVTSYGESSKVRNGLKLVWKLDETTVWDKSSFQLIAPTDTDTALNSKPSVILVPAWPMVIAKYDLVVNGKEAVEIGLEYGYHYWQAYLEKESKPVEATAAQ